MSKFLSAEVDWVKGGFGGEDVEKRGIVCLNDEKEDLLSRDMEQSRANNDMCRIGPYSAADEVGIPRDC